MATLLSRPVDADLSVLRTTVARMQKPPLVSHDQRLRLESLRYAVNDEAVAYIAIMRTFTGTTSGLLSDQSAAEVARRLADHGLVLDVETVDERLSYLVERGNLARSPREAEARSIREYLQTRSRYQLTQRGEVVHRQVEELLLASDTAREVSSEMLPALLAGLRQISAYDGTTLSIVEPEELAGQITTLFAQFERLVESTREFYAYLSEVLRRFDLDREEFQTFKGALIGYLQRFVDQIALHMPQIADLSMRVESRLDLILARADEGRRLVGVDGERARRARGLVRDDWWSLHAWFVGEPGRDSDAAQVRALATDAMSALLVNLRRIAATGDREQSRYRDLLRLAGWFDAVDDETAHALWAAAFGLYSCRHLSFAQPEQGEPVGPTRSWWEANPVEVPLTLREYGNRALRGRSGQRSDFSVAKAHRLAERAAAERRHRAALRELAGIPGQLDHARVSDDARLALLDLYAKALAGSGTPIRAGELAARSHDGLQLLVRSAPGESTVVTSPQGRMQWCDVSLFLEVDQAQADEAATA